MHAVWGEEYYTSRGNRLRITFNRYGAAPSDINDNLGIGMGMTGQAVHVGEVAVQAQTTALTSWKVDRKRLEKERAVIFHARE
jgi:hypothetical protein